MASPCRRTGIAPPRRACGKAAGRRGGTDAGCLDAAAGAVSDPGFRNWKNGNCAATAQRNGCSFSIAECVIDPK